MTLFHARIAVRERGWRKVCMLDCTLASIARDVRKAASSPFKKGESDKPHFIISNTDQMGDSGQHWFTVAYSMSKL